MHMRSVAACGVLLLLAGCLGGGAGAWSVEECKEAVTQDWAAWFVGTVQDPRGRPLDGALVTAFGGTGTKSDEADRHGCYAFEVDAGATYTLRASLAGYSSATTAGARADEGSTTYTFALQRS